MNRITSFDPTLTYRHRSWCFFARERCWLI